MPEISEQQQNHQRLQQVNKALGSGMFVHVRKLLQNMPAYDIALILESSHPKSRAVLWQLIDADNHGEVLEELNEEVRKGILKTIRPEKLAAVAEGMDVDDLAEVLRTLPDSVYQEVLSAMDSQDRGRVEAALSFEEDTAGGIMNTDTITIRPDVTVDVVLRYLRLRGDLPEATDSFYVVDGKNHFIGAVSLAAIITAKPEIIVSTLIDKDIEAIQVHLSDSDVAQLFEKFDWFSAPVIDDEGRLLGRITIDDVIDIIREDAEHSMMSMAGLDGEADTFAPVLKSTQQRSIWLGVNLITALLAVAVSSMFEGVLSQLAILAILNSLVPSMGGVAGNQTLTLVVRAIALGHVGDSNARILIQKELAVGFLNGVIWAVLIAGVVAIWQQNLMLGGVIAFAMLMNLTAAGIAGVAIPLFLKRMNIDPALAGSVILTTITDVVGIFAFLGTATLFLT
ncbi:MULTISPECIES: magnesium transporter [unclassified Colwellia]|jgi:magnesium transporter|uniref:magnesium transporter n=1 Tax=unclassified Colwellia TaxID=196834 RepID=UPI0015F5772F|nr:MULTISPECIES: magnesium transporter [unclassified Colwellia]MBA6362645.1 magnesium transporter [Colwellia sp. BRX8-8]MBA6338034.1 magnesium transporter [Colwellia sp. BRX8-7]MBA6346955.1 magnesium transporter [Colwellia sp. BRX8-9]MBA6350599.1 magnesium transporter [Colwellia sp. BRX9-1]MBA6355313.1 magnesium transporter [Colwellia sp. BRX8-3]